MERLKRVLGVAALATVTVFARASEKSKTEVAHQDGRLVQDVDILSDTQGVNFRPYMQAVLSEIHDQWASLIPEGSPPGSTEIRLKIQPDGTISAMHMDDSTNDDALNRAAWGSLTGVGQLPRLPAKFHGADVEMRIHFVVSQ